MGSGMKKMNSPNPLSHPSILNKIEALQCNLRKSEQRVAAAILSAPDKVIRLSISALANRAQVSQPTVMRFCHALGYSGFQDFKLLLAQDLASQESDSTASQMSYAQQDIYFDDQPEQLAEKVINSTVGAIHQLPYHLDYKSIAKAISLIVSAARIECYGLGGSGIIAQDAQLKFARLGIAVVAYSDAQVHQVSASLLTSKDIVLAISNSGRSKALLQSIDYALANKAKVIAITPLTSPLAERATITLSYSANDPNDNYELIKTRILPLLIVDMLTIGVALKKGPEILTKLTKIQHVLRHAAL